MRLLSIAALVLVGCGGGPPANAGRLRDICNVPWWGDVYLYTFNVSCDEVKQRFSLAHLAISGFTDDSTFQGTPVYVLDVDCLERWDFEDGTPGFYCKRGETSLDGVVLEKDLIGLAHEMFHLLDKRNVRVGSSWHEGWGPAGYNGASDAYEYLVLEKMRADRMAEMALEGEGAE